MEQKTIIRILALHDLVGRRFLVPQKGYRNTAYGFEAGDGRMYNLMLYKNEPGIIDRIRRADAVSEFLAAGGYPARRPLGKIIQLQTRPRGAQTKRYARLYNYLPGTTIPWEAYTMDHIKLLGKTMGDMHSQLRSYQDAKKLPDAISKNQRLVKQMRDYFEQPDVAGAMNAKLGLQIDMMTFVGANLALRVCRQLKPRQVLHMDFVRGNILFDGKPAVISGILDFEKTAHGPAVFDVARTLAFLLVDCKYKQPDKVIKYFIESGYQKRGPQPLDYKQLSLLKALTRLYLVHDFYKFLKHNPYESLAGNEHFVRTRDILVKDDIISRIAPVRDNANRR